MTERLPFNKNLQSGLLVHTCSIRAGETSVTYRQTYLNSEELARARLLRSDPKQRVRTRSTARKLLPGFSQGQC